MKEITHSYQEATVKLILQENKEEKLVVSIIPHTCTLVKSFYYKNHKGSGVGSHAAQKVFTFYEGVVYGVRYAYEIYQQESLLTQGFEVTIQHIHPQKLGVNHELVAVATAQAFWKLVDFIPSQPISYLEETHQYIFPKATNMLPIESVTPAEYGRDFTRGYKFFEAYALAYEQRQKQRFDNQA